MLDNSVLTDPRATDRLSGVQSGGSAPHPRTHFVHQVLPGMVARGHGIEALCLYLDLARTVLLDLVVELGLPTPHDRPPRKAGGRNPWSFADTALFIVLWMAGWHAESLGKRFGRSSGGIWAKARRLGLPRRDRKLVFRPFHPGEYPLADVPRAVDSVPARAVQPRSCSFVQRSPTQIEDCGTDDLLTVSWPAPAAASYLADASVYAGTTLGHDTPTADNAVVSLLPPCAEVDLFGPTPAASHPPRQAKRREIEWTRERDRELAQRWWARQHYKAIARDMGMSPSAVQSRRIRLELPTFNDLPDLFLLRREELVDHFDPSVVEAHIAAAGYVERKCATFAESGKAFWFWAKRSGNRSSEESRRLERRRTAWFRPLPSPVRPSEPILHAW